MLLPDKNVKVIYYLFNAVQFCYFKVFIMTRIFNSIVIKPNSVEKVVGYFNILIENLTEMSTKIKKKSCYLSLLPACLEP
jgi:hypothetical protein